jgi:hypothetical protein
VLTRLEYEELANFKRTIEEAEAKKTRLASIREKFNSANLKVTDEYLMKSRNFFWNVR